MDTKKGLTPPRRWEVATLAVYLLGGGRRSVDTEDIAIRCHDLAPEMFSWRKHADQINLELVRVSLSDAKKTKAGGLLGGSGREGWRLSSKGLAWIAGRGRVILGAGLIQIDVRDRRAGSVDSVRLRREQKRILQSAAWTAWRQSGRVNLPQAREFFRLDGYATSEMVDRKVARLLSVFEHDRELRQFIEAAGAAVRLQGRVK